MKKPYLLLLLFLIINIAFAQTIPATRIADWSSCGYPGQIPDPQTVIDVTTFGAVGDGITDDFASINNAILSLSGLQGVIYFPPGTYLLGSTLNLPDSLILRGASADSTHLNFNLNGAVGNAINISGSTPTAFTNVLSGYQRGSNSIVVADVSSFSIGDFAELQEDNGTWDAVPVSWADHSVGQILHITNISGDTLFFDQVLRINYDASLNVQVRKLEPAHEIGIECMQISRADSVHAGVCINIYFNYAVNCWVRGVESSKSIGSHIEADASSNIEISGCYIHHCFEYDGTSTHGYGITLFKHTVQCKVENNIMEHLRHSFSLQCGSNGNVIAYNYSLDPFRSEFPTNFGADISMHGHFTFSNLFEGNIVQNLQIDSTWGPTGPYNTYFRNRADLYGIFMSAGVVPTDSQNFVGNEVTYALFGQYLILGSGHFEFGNNIRGTITPSGTSPLPDTSYYLDSVPSFWTSGLSWPSIGIPNAISSGTIPAKNRYAPASHNNAVCAPIITTNVGQNLNNRNLFNLYPNPSNDLVEIEFNSDLFHQIIQVEIMNSIGETLKSFKSPSNKNIVIKVSDLVPGIYFVKVFNDSGKLFGTKQLTVIR